MLSDRRMLFFGMVFCVLVSCTQIDRKNIDYERLRETLIQDTSLSRYSHLIDTIIQFFSREIPHQSSQRLSIGQGRSMVHLDELSVSQIDSLRDQLSPTSRIRFETIRDEDFIDEEFLADRIRYALKMAERYPWNHTIPDSILINYLVPYKFMDEFPSKWWSFLAPHYKDSIKLWSSPDYTRFDAADTRQVSIYSTFLMGQLPEWWYYDAMANTYTKYPSLNEILLLRYGGCYIETMINAMITRTWGIPAAVEEIPYWGSQNGSHAAEAFWNPAVGKMVSDPDFSISDNHRRPAKIVRYTFRKTDAFSRQIKPYLNGDAFQIPQMSGDHWFDATGQHTDVAKVEYPVGSSWPDKIKLGYIYVMDYGQWVPIHYGVVEGDRIHFRNMGVDIIYRVGYYSAGQHHMVSKPFLLQDGGQLKFSEPSREKLITVPVLKYNNGNKAVLEIDESYTLQFLDENGVWKDHATLVCRDENPLLFTDVPAGAFYWLKFPSDTRSLSRIFLLNDQGEQWWY